MCALGGYPMILDTHTLVLVEYLLYVTRSAV